MWKGTAATLNPSPATMSARPTSNAGLRGDGSKARTACISENRVVPSIPYTWLMP